MRLAIYIWFSALVLLPCFTYGEYLEEDSGNSLISLKQNGITKSESAKTVGTIVAIAIGGALLAAIGMIQPLLLGLLLLPLVIVWIGLSGISALVMTGFSYEDPHQPYIPLPIRFIFLFIWSLFLTPKQALEMLLIDYDDYSYRRYPG